MPESLLSRLKKARLFRVLLVYGAASWAVPGVAGTLQDVLQPRVADAREQLQILSGETGSGQSPERHP